MYKCYVYYLISLLLDVDAYKQPFQVYKFRVGIRNNIV